MRRKLRSVCEAGLLVVTLIGSAQCSSNSAKTSVEPSCKKHAQSPEVRSGPDCKEAESPVLLECVDPDYPPDVRKNRLSGKVVATATLYPDARLGGVTVVSSPSEVLSKLALEAFRQWRYKPAFCRDLGKPIEVTITMTTTFSLH